MSNILNIEFGTDCFALFFVVFFLLNLGCGSLQTSLKFRVGELAAGRAYGCGCCVALVTCERCQVTGER